MEVWSFLTFVSVHSYPGTIRSNLDPFGIYPDDKLWDALKRAYLTETDADNSASQKFTLDTVVEDEGLNLSVGERSLVSLARALTKDAKVGFFFFFQFALETNAGPVFLRFY